MPSHLLTPRVSELVEAIRGEVLDGTSTTAIQRSVERVAGVLASYLHHEDLLAADQMEADSRTYRQHVLHVEPDGSFSVVALVWLPGQQTAIHDHLSWCVVGTYRGVEEETTYRVESDGGQVVLVPTSVQVNPVGSVSHLVPPGDIHIVRNATTVKAVSLHIYGADVSVVGSSIRRRYELPVRTQDCREVS